MADSETRVIRHQLTIFSRFGRAHGSFLPHHLTGQQAPPRRRALVVRFDGVVKTERYITWEARPPRPAADLV